VHRLLFSPEPPRGRFAILRNHPFITAAGAASVGVFLGAYVAVQLIGGPVKKDEAARSPQITAETKAAPATPVAPAAETKTPAAAAETTGSAPPRESTAAAADCDNQTWPYLSRECIEQMQAKKSSPRVITTDRLDEQKIGAIEPAPKVEPAPATVPAAPVSPPAVAAAPPPAPANPPAVAATPASPPAASTQVTSAVTVGAPSPPGANVAPPPEVKSAARTKDARTRKAKAKSKTDSKFADTKARSDDDDDDDTVASVGTDRRTVGSGSGRTVERWTEQEYSVPASDGRGQRRVTVIRRDNSDRRDSGSFVRHESSGGLFERRESGGLFGNIFGFR
jgi:hypothetical protein